MTTSSSSTVAVIGFAAALVCAAAAVVSGFGSRFDWWPFTTGFSLLRWSAYGAVAALIVSAAGLMLGRKRGRDVGWAAAGLVIAGVVIAVPLSWVYTAMRVPRIHDITTDTVNPPQFEAILPLRRNAPNPATYGGPAVAAQQLKAYPDIKPLIVPDAPGQVFDRALAVARRQGWEVVAADSSRGRIEATDTTFWFGFKDDVVVRITPAAQGSRVDVRSVSRVGLSDIGTNAARIRRFLAAMKGS